MKHIINFIFQLEINQPLLLCFVRLFQIIYKSTKIIILRVLIESKQIHNQYILITNQLKFLSK